MRLTLIVLCIKDVDAKTPALSFTAKTLYERFSGEVDEGFPYHQECVIYIACSHSYRPGND